ncbi:MAG: hypothetical protein HZB40_11520 [Rhodocyclales bacterium]|nr:hypothetical protein [Rhodocyclales bacterium]
MKLKTTLATALLVAVSSFNSHAADAGKTPAVKPHSHMEEKTGMAAKAVGATAADKAESAKTDKVGSAKQDVTKDKTTHLHPRDGK